MAADKNIIIAFELGSSAIRGVAGRKEADGSVHILAIEQEVISGSIRRGTVYNINKTTSAITRIKERLNERLGVYITRAYVGIAGQSLHAVANKVVHAMTTKEKITQEMIDNLMDENRAMHYTDCQILDVVPQEYHLGIDKTTDPIGIQTDKIEGRYLNIIARTSLQENIRRCMHDAGIDVIDIFITPLEIAKQLIPDSEKRSGCALVDIGAETTTVAIFYKNILRRLVTIPLGGNNVTLDIAKIEKMEMDEAEDMKLRYGVAQISDDQAENTRMLHISNSRTIAEDELQSICCTRYDEILANVWHQITKDKWEDELLSGITLTGQAARMAGLQEALTAVSKFKPNQIKTTKEMLASMSTAAGVDSSKTGFNGAIALLLGGNENCTGEKEEEEKSVEETVVEESNVEASTDTNIQEPETPEPETPAEPKPKGPGIFTQIGNFISRIVNEGE